MTGIISYDIAIGDGVSSAGRLAMRHNEGTAVSNLQSEVFEAFRAIEIPEDKALKAATALSRRDDDVLSLKRDMAVLKWMVGTLYPLVLAILIKLFIH